MGANVSARLVLKGIPVSPGIAIGPSYPYHPENREAVKRLISGEKVDQEIARLDRALDRAHQEIVAIKNRIRGDVGEYEARIFDSHLLILKDEEILLAVRKNIRENLYNAEYAYYLQMNLLEERFDSAAGGFLKEHMIDLRDVATRVIDSLMLDENSKSAPELTDPVIVLSRNLSPSELSQFSRQHTLGLGIEIGGKTSHVAILARSMGIPAVSGLIWEESAMEMGRTLIVDGDEGVVIFNPSLLDIKEYEAKRSANLAEDEQLSAQSILEPVTRDGKYVALSANLELSTEAESVLKSGGGGVGLYRSEFLFLAREEMPSEEEQYQAYRQLAETLAPRAVTIRTLDAGGDKLVPALKMLGERNPYMGWRSIRVCLANPEFFKVQLRAILRASVTGNVRMMFPMITTVQEMREARRLVEESKSELRAAGTAYNPDIEIGCMVEVPSAVLLSVELAKEADFFSIGTNDLVQFTLAVDRANERIADLFEPLSPAVLRQIRAVVDAAHWEGIPVSVCGEMAAEPYSAILFIGMGVDELSMGPGALLEMKRWVRGISFEDARRCAHEVLAMSTAREINSWVRKSFEGKLAKAGLPRIDR